MAAPCRTTSRLGEARSIELRAALIGGAGGCRRRLVLREDLHRIEGVADLDRTGRDIGIGRIEQVAAVAARVEPLPEQPPGLDPVDAAGLPVAGGILAVLAHRCRIGEGGKALAEAVAIARLMTDIATERHVERLGAGGPFQPLISGEQLAPGA